MDVQRFCSGSFTDIGTLEAVKNIVCAPGHSSFDGERFARSQMIESLCFFPEVALSTTSASVKATRK